MAPQSVIEDATLSVNARLLFIILDARAGSRRVVSVRVEVLAVALGKSAATTKRALEELEARGLLQRSRTLGTSRTVVHNPARAPRGRRLTSAPAYGSPMSRRSSKNDLSKKQQQQPAASEGSAIEARELLGRIIEATGTPIKPTAVLMRTLREAVASGRADDMPIMATAWLATVAGNVGNPAGYLAGYILPALAEGRRGPQNSKSERAPREPRQKRDENSEPPAEPETVAAAVAKAREAIRAAR